MVTDICAWLKNFTLFIQKTDCNIGHCQNVFTSTIDGLTEHIHNLFLLKFIVGSLKVMFCSRAKKDSSSLK